MSIGTSQVCILRGDDVGEGGKRSKLIKGLMTDLNFRILKGLALRGPRSWAASYRFVGSCSSVGLALLLLSKRNAVRTQRKDGITNISRLLCFAHDRQSIGIE